MKHITILIVFLLATIMSYAQSPVIDIEEYSRKDAIENAYYKDINNFIDPFVGTWVYTETCPITGNETVYFKIVLEKELMTYNGEYYLDMVIGEYQYKENEVELRNTLNNTSLYYHGIYRWGNPLLKSDTYPLCSDCPANERRLQLIIRDRVRKLGGSITLKLFTDHNGQQAIEGFIYGRGVSYYEIDNPPPYFYMIIPTGTFVFVKE